MKLLLSKDCYTFIEKYDQLFSKYSKNKYKEEKNAYTFNEDRDNLTMVKSIAGPVDDCKKEMPANEIHRTIEAVIQSNKRNTNYSNMKVFKDGVFFTEHNNSGQHKLCLKVYNYIHKGKIKIKINGTEHKATAFVKDSILVLKSPLFDNENLLLYNNISFYQDHKKIMLNNFVFSFSKNTKISNFAF